jgi:uncharacterized membrane protein
VIVINKRKPGGRLHPTSAGRRVTYAMLAGAVAGSLVLLATTVAASILLGWDVAALIYLAWTLTSVWKLDPHESAELAKREDPSNALAELVVLGAGTAMLGAVGYALIAAGQATGGMKAYLVAVGVLSVVLSWLVVHTVFGLRYARAYYSEPVGGIEFNEAEPPNYLDFAYYAFTIGMTFQVSDTNITRKAVRRTTLHHALLSYLFGSVLLGLVINVVAALLK